MEAVSNFETRRSAEIEAGRNRVLARAKDAGTDDKHVRDAVKAGDEELKRDDERRQDLLTRAPDSSQAERDMAGAEIADQAQTENEALIHHADQQERIVAAEHQQSVEAMEHPTSDPAAATELTTDVVTAQAVNQPTVLAHEDGADTENRPLTSPGFEADEMSPRTPTPKDKHVPKTRRRAERVAKGKVPPAEEVLAKPGWQQPGPGPNADVAVEQVRSAEDDILGPGEAP